MGWDGNGTLRWKMGWEIVRPHRRSEKWDEKQEKQKWANTGAVPRQQYEVLYFCWYIQ